MGLMDKIRDMFTEEVEVNEEQPIKKEVIQVEIPAPVKKEKVEEEIIKKEEKVSSPIFFDDKDFASIEKPKKVDKKVNNYFEKPKKKEEVKQEKKEKKVFKPSPIISPIYGVLDKNYHKEDIKTKNNSFNNTYYNHKDVSIDDIRKKAYGTLEDDLEITLYGIKEEKNQINEDIDMFDELMEHNEKDEFENTEKIDGNELFNLIDTMYEKEDDNNGVY